jgi:hypothetical protein
MKVSISQAAKMAGVQRSTFYRHIDEKGISLEDKGSKRPKVDVSELVRVYGNKLKALEQTDNEEPSHELTDRTVSNTFIEGKIEVEMLREKLKHLEELKNTEKAHLEEQIAFLKAMLESEREERKRATAILTDQRALNERKAEQEKIQSEKFLNLESAVKQILETQRKEQENKSRKKNFFGRLME